MEVVRHRGGDRERTRRDPGILVDMILGAVR
jgi:hypothetical protein